MYDGTAFPAWAMLCGAQPGSVCRLMPNLNFRCIPALPNTSRSRDVNASSAQRGYHNSLTSMQILWGSCCPASTSRVVQPACPLAPAAEGGRVRNLKGNICGRPQLRQPATRSRPNRVWLLTQTDCHHMMRRRYCDRCSVPTVPATPISD